MALMEAEVCGFRTGRRMRALAEGEVSTRYNERAVKGCVLLMMSSIVVMAIPPTSPLEAVNERKLDSTRGGESRSTERGSGNSC